MAIPTTYRGQAIDRVFWGKVFDSIDTDSDGFIGAQDLAKFIAASRVARKSKQKVVFDAERQDEDKQQETAELRTLVAMVLHLRDPRGLGIARLFPSLDSFGRGVISRPDFVGLLQGEDLGHEKSRRALAAVVQTLNGGTDTDTGPSGTAYGSTASKGRSMDRPINPTLSSSVARYQQPKEFQRGSKSKVVQLVTKPGHMGGIDAGMTETTTTTGAGSNKASSTTTSTAPPSDRRTFHEQQVDLLKKPMSIWRRSRPGEQLAFRRSVLATIFVALDSTGGGRGYITASQLQGFLGDLTPEHKFLRKQFRIMARGCQAFDKLFEQVRVSPTFLG